jgi:hypothetical protein
MTRDGYTIIRFHKKWSLEASGFKTREDAKAFIHDVEHPDPATGRTSTIGKVKYITAKTRWGTWGVWYRFKREIW